jgi:predicted enzyme related to lactoylglutathione lyase
MPERSGYIPGVPCWVDTTQPDPAAAVQFYGQLFGWKLEDAMPAGSGMSYHIATIRDGSVAAIGPIPQGAPQMAMWNTYVSVASADDAAAKIREAGGTAMDAFDVMDAGRMAVASDPEGAMFAVWQPKNTFGAQIVNEHGALNFNVLATRDLERAKEFYGAVFGWETLSIPAGVMWTLPGYGDHLEESTPGLRQGMEQMGAPPGFIDVVAAVNPIAGNDSSTPAHWGVTFGVDDVEAIAAKAKELGADIVAGPFDAPWCRMAVIKDPQGAIFVASQFVMENKNVVA